MQFSIHTEMASNKHNLLFSAMQSGKGCSEQLTEELEAKGEIYSAVSEQVNYHEVYERDKGICGLCSGFVSPFVFHPGPQSESDHLMSYH